MEQDSSGYMTEEDTHGGLHPAVDRRGLSEAKQSEVRQLGLQKIRNVYTGFAGI